jgi:CO/xanthine dehydrogenase Mo-binding subunit
MGAKYFGAAVRRREDPRFLRGQGRFVDDVTLPGLLHAAFVRSPHAHARITRLETKAARGVRGVAAVFTFADLADRLKPLPVFGAPPPGLAAAIAFELRQAEQLYRKIDIPFVNTASMSIEEIATVAMQEKGLRRATF